MKRAFPQKVKPVSCYPFAVEATVGQSKQNPTGVNRKVRTSAAMIGLALSMGASSLLLPRQDDGAVAAEPVAAESTFALTPLAQQVATLPVAPDIESVDSLSVPSDAAIGHVVQEGQTVWRLAQRYQVSVQAIAAVNGIGADSTLQVGQVLIIPNATSGLSPDLTSDLAANVDAEVKTERDQALNRLRQERNKLRNSLAGLRREAPEPLPSQPPKEQQPSRSSVDGLPRESVLSHRPVSEVSAQNEVQTESRSVSSEPGSFNELSHQVRPGETLGAIALLYGVPQQTLVAANSIADPDWLRANQALVIPSGSSGLDSEPVVSAPTTQFSVDAVQPVEMGESVPAFPVDSVVYRVSPGDTLGEIATAYGIPQQSLANTNQLQNPNLIVAGQVLQIPAANEAIAQVSPPVDDSLVVVAPSEATSLDATTVGVSEPTVVDEPVAVVESIAVTEPTVPIEGAIALTGAESSEITEKVDPTSVDAIQPIAVAPLRIAPEAIEGSESAPEGAFVENLLAEITTLRDRYRVDRSNSSPEAQQSSVQEPVVVAAAELLPVSSSDLSSATALNPELPSTQSSEPIEAENSEVRPIVLAEQVQTGANAESPSVNRSRLVAAAPLGSENYAPLVQPIAGQVVSPDLPPLPGASAYLPNLSPQFDGFIWPARGTLTSGYGWRWGRMHRGIDIGAPSGTPVYAVAEGTVQFSGWNSGGYGNMVEIRHADGTMTRYAHHSRNLVRAGQQVEQGQHIAAVGSTGYSTGPHLHFEVHLPSQGTVNPIAYLPR